MANTPDPQPLDLEDIRRRWADADEFSGTLRWNPIVRDLVDEVERLRAEVDRLTPRQAYDWLDRLYPNVGPGCD
jgi:hypothetical protein